MVLKNVVDVTNEMLVSEVATFDVYPLIDIYSCFDGVLLFSEFIFGCFKI